ncbi:MAG: hypothetical protein Q9175_003789 [Cornicularia normoerica]
MDSPPVATRFSGYPNYTFSAFLDSKVNPIVDSHGALVEICREVEILCQHAAARGYSHPGIQKFQQCMTERPPKPHAQKFNAAVLKFGGLDVRDIDQVHRWQEEIVPVIASMDTCEERLRTALNEKVVKAFVAMERKVVAKEEVDKKKAN